MVIETWDFQQIQLCSYIFVQNYRTLKHLNKEKYH